MFLAADVSVKKLRGKRASASTLEKHARDFLPSAPFILVFSFPQQREAVFFLFFFGKNSHWNRSARRL